MKKLSIILALGFILSACSEEEQEAREIVNNWNDECHATMSNRHWANFACAFQTFGRIIVYPIDR